MQLLIPYNLAKLDINTRYNGDIKLTILNDPELYQSIVSQFFDTLSKADFINAIGAQQFEQLIEFYNSPDFEE